MMLKHTPIFIFFNILIIIDLNIIFEIFKTIFEWISMIKSFKAEGCYLGLW